MKSQTNKIKERAKFRKKKEEVSKLQEAKKPCEELILKFLLIITRRKYKKTVFVPKYHRVLFVKQ